MTQSLNWRRSAGITLIIILIAGIEIWALNTPMVRNLQIDAFGPRSVRNLSIRLDLVLVLPLALLILAHAWFKPAWLTGKLAPWSGHLRRVSRSVAWMIAIWLTYAVLRSLSLPATTGLILLGIVEGGFLIFVGMRVIRLTRQVRPLRQSGYSLVTALMQSVPRAWPGGSCRNPGPAFASQIIAATMTRYSSLWPFSFVLKQYQCISWYTITVSGLPGYLRCSAPIRCCGSSARCLRAATDRPCSPVTGCV